MSELLNKLVANDKYGQLVKTGTTVRRASLHLLPLARFCVSGGNGGCVRSYTYN